MPAKPANDNSDTHGDLSRARFLTSAHELRQLPADDGREVVFAGRSNTGKSSVINTLCNHKALARTSRTPGRTQQIVVFQIDAKRRLIDLPGFGYAKVARSLRAHWDRVVPAYLENRRSLAGLVLVTDVRHPLKTHEQSLLAWCAAAQVPVHVLLNKCDKLGRSQARATVMQTSKTVEQLHVQGGVQLFSSHTKEGLEETRSIVLAWLTDT
jgi:GTP-binding protein